MHQLRHRMSIVLLAGLLGACGHLLAQPEDLPRSQTGPQRAACIFAACLT